MHACREKERKRIRFYGSRGSGRHRESGGQEHDGPVYVFLGNFVAALPPPLLLLLLHKLEELKKASVIEGLGMLCPPSSEQRQAGANLW